jgi:hypothetical protein
MPIPEVQPNDPDPFEGFESADEVVAFIHRKFGDEGVRQCFKEGHFYREFLEGVVLDLRAVGLNKAAAVVTEIAANSPSEVEECPYREGTANYVSWHRSLKWKQQTRAEKRSPPQVLERLR